MKGIYILFSGILVALMLSSCTEEYTDGTENATDSSIGFATKDADWSDESFVTRGTPLDAVTKIPNMGVYAYYTGNGTANNWTSKGATATPGFLNGITVTQTSGVWSYAHKVYWPQAADAHVSFFAYSPVATTGSNGNGISVASTTGVPKLTYSMPATCANQPDLLVAVPQKDRNRDNNGTAPVNFSFKHALTSVGFKLAGAGQKVTSIKMKGGSVSGTLSMDGATITWTNLSAPQSTEFTAGLSGSDIESTDVLTKIMSGDGFLMMIPQTLTANAELTVTFSNWATTTINLSGKQWKAGETVWYGLSMPESEVVGRFAGEVVGPVSNGDYEEYYYSKTLEVAAIDAPTTFQWSMTDGVTTITDRMAGKNNTYNLYQLGATVYPAVKYCFEKNVGYSAISSATDARYQWYLPARNQLFAIWIATPILKSRIVSSYDYWSSSEYDVSNSYVSLLGTGYVHSVSKNTPCYVRCVREVSM